MRAPKEGGSKAFVTCGVGDLRGEGARHPWWRRRGGARGAREVEGFGVRPLLPCTAVTTRFGGALPPPVLAEEGPRG